MTRLQDLPGSLQSILATKRARMPSEWRHNGVAARERKRRREEIATLETLLKVSTVVGRHADEFKVWFRLKTGHEF